MPQVKQPTAAATSLKKVDELVKTATVAYKSASEAVQTAAVAIITHAKDYGDCTRAKVLARGVPARERNSLIGYFALYSPIGVNIGKTAKEDECRFIKPESKQYHDFNLDGAKANKWYDDPAKVNAEPKPLNTLSDFYEIVDRLLKNAVAQAAKDDDDNRYRPEDREAVAREAAELRTMVAKFHAKSLAARAANEADVIEQEVKQDAANQMAAAGA